MDPFQRRDEVLRLPRVLETDLRLPALAQAAIPVVARGVVTRPWPLLRHEVTYFMSQSAILEDLFGV